MSEADEQALKIAAIEKETKQFVCPSCHAHLQFRVHLRVTGVREVAAPQAESESERGSLSLAQAEQLERYKANGVFDAFVKAVQVSGANAVPRDLERAFFTALSSATRKASAPQFAIRMALPAEDRCGNLELWKSSLVSIVVRNGEVLTFLPNEIVEGADATGRLTPNGVSERYSLTDWVKTRFGYVAGRGLMLSEMRQPSAGAFDSARL